MSIGDFLRLPPAVRIAFVVMVWPAVWAAALTTVALAADILRQTRRREASRSGRTVVLRG